MVGQAQVSNKNITVPAFLIALTVASGFVLMGLQIVLPGWILLAITACATAISGHPSRRLLLPVQGSLALLGLAPINTNINFGHMTYMGTMIALAVAVPAYLSIRVYHDGAISFPWRIGRRWSRSEILYIAFTA